MWGALRWSLYYTVLTPTWILANGDLVFMSKVAEETVMKGRYPFDNEYLSSIRPSYVFYPTPFMLQAILSIVTSIDVRALMYIPVLMYTVNVLTIIITVLLVKNYPRPFLPLAVIPLLSFLNPQPTYFVYSHISRALLLLFVYFVFVKWRLKSLPFSASTVLMLLALSSVIGHSQEPMTFSISILLIYSFVWMVDRKERSPSYTPLLFVLIMFVYNIYVSTHVFENVLSWLYRQFLMALIPEASVEALVQKSSIAQGVLTAQEFVIMVMGFVMMLFYTIVILLWHTIRAVFDKNWTVLAITIAIFMYGLIALIPLLIPGLGTDLFWRPLWSLFIALSAWPAVVIHRRNRAATKTADSDAEKRPKSTTLLCLALVVMILFGLSNALYMRVHLISSDVYTHEASTINVIYSSSLVTHVQRSEISSLLIIDSPNQPAYEIGRALVFLPMIKQKILFLNPEVKHYVNLKYLNGLTKARELELTSTSIEGFDHSMTIGSLNDYQVCTTANLKDLIFSAGKIVAFK